MKSKRRWRELLQMLQGRLTKTGNKTKWADWFSLRYDSSKHLSFWISSKNPKEYDVQLLEQVRDHGIKYKATTYYAGVGFAHADDYELPLTQNDPYAVNFDGLQIMD